MNKGSPAKIKYDAAYNARPEEVKKRAERNKARAMFEKKNGNLSASTDVDHKKMLVDGGSNKLSNLRAVSQTENRGWRHEHKAEYGKKK